MIYKATALLTTPSKTHFFIQSCRLYSWELPCIWASGLKPPSSFFMVFARRGNINPFSDGIYRVLSSSVCFFQEVFLATAPNLVHRFTPSLCIQIKLFTWCKTCLQFCLSNEDNGVASTSNAPNSTNANMPHPSPTKTMALHQLPVHLVQRTLKCPTPLHPTPTKTMV